MPRQKDFKRLVRARMQKTGEAYTAARAQLLGKPRTATPASTAARSGRPMSDAGMAKLAGHTDATMVSRTGRTWPEWADLLDRERAQQMTHRDIARLVNTKYDIPGWWAQAVTVGYERIRSLRARGQRRDGSYEINKSKTFPVPLTTLFAAWSDAKQRRQWLDAPGMKLRGTTPGRTVRLNWPDGAIITAYFEAKGAARSTVVVQHPKLPDRQAAEQLKAFWSERLAALGVILQKRQPGPAATSRR